MPQEYILLPAMALILWTFIAVIRMGSARIRSVIAGEISLDYFRLYQGHVLPEQAQKLSRNYHNLLEMPPLFYSLLIMAYVTSLADIPMLVMAWLYFFLRVSHTLVHTRSNRIRLRFRLFLASLLVMAALWIWLLYHLLVKLYA